METSPPLVVALGDPAAADATLAGAKAANLARAAAAGLPTLPGFALTTASFRAEDPAWSDGPDPDVVSALRAAWEDVSNGGTRAVVVRSSSTVEDIGESSMAGQFRSVLDVVGWDAFLAAVRDVLASAKAAATGGEVLPMGVLVQAQLDARSGGVAFGIEPVSGDPHHYVIEAVKGGPEQLVSGTVTAQRYVVGHRGRVVQADEDECGGRLLQRRELRAVARLVRGAGRAFGSPQDIEWALDDDGRLFLLQSRPVTATGRSTEAAGPVLGPGPIGETFPDPLRRLEEDLWIAPMREGIIRALLLTGVVSRRRLASSPVVILVEGRVAADLDLFGYTAYKRSGWRILDPRPGARRLLAAWRIGQVRNVLGERVAGVLRQCDADLAAVAPLSSLDDGQLIGVIGRCREHLVSVHGHEVLSGTLLPEEADAPSAAAVALAALAQGRASRLDDAQIVAAAPVVLALVPPRVDGPGALPALTDDATTWRTGWSGSGDLGASHLDARDALRLRARWLHELSARAADELARRAARATGRSEPFAVADLGIDELARLAGGVIPDDLLDRARALPGPPLPAAFRRTPAGVPVPVRRGGAHRSGGRGAGGGRGEGVVGNPKDGIEPGEVLVVRTLSPRLAAYLPSLAGLVAETGGVLSHLAILAREYGVPTVVAVPDAMHRYPPGTRLLIDGDTGELEVLDAPGAPAAHDRGNDGDEREAAWAD